MNLIEKKINLFKTPEDYALAHCVSRDFKMGAGIARQFRKLYPDMASYCLAQKPKVGSAVKYQANNRTIFNLVTKNRYYQKPTYHALEKSLAHMKSQILSSQGITKLAMPLIGCGLDKLVWSKVAQIIKDTFKDTNIEILICRL